MSRTSRHRSTARLQRGAAARARTRYVLRLYVAGLTSRSVAAIATVKNTCEQHLAGRYELEIVNLHDRPTLARGEQVIAAPTLIKKLPLPLRRIIGDMADTDKLLVGLDLRQREP